MGRTARCAAAALAAVVAGGALGLAADARAVDGPYDYVAVSFLLLASALVVGGVVVLLVALADRLLGRLPTSSSETAPTPVPAAPVLAPEEAVRTSDSEPAALAAAWTTTRRHAVRAGRAATSATHRAAAVRRSATSSLTDAVTRSVAAARAAGAARSTAAHATSPEGPLDDESERTAVGAGVALATSSPAAARDLDRPQHDD